MAVEAGEDGARWYGVLVGLVPALSVTQAGSVALALPVQDGIQPGGGEEKPVEYVQQELDIGLAISRFLQWLLHVLQPKKKNLHRLQYKNTRLQNCLLPSTQFLN